MIEPLRRKDTQTLFEKKCIARFVNIEQVARRKLKQLHAATGLAFLRIPPKNRLESLKGNRKGNGASATTSNVEIVGYSFKATMMKRLELVTPGEILLEEWLKPMGVSQYRLALEIGVPPRRINEIVHGKRAITADTALRLARFFGTDAQSWLNLQSHFDMEKAEIEVGKALQKIVPWSERAAA
jgi:antitoxin HigA-1